ncbi:MAG: F0F1 ATP synthase subunit B [Candidatus Glassbacteria bacterium]
MAQTSLLDVNPGLIFWTLATFIILLLLLKKFVWGPILAAVDRREENLRQMFESAEKSKAQAEELLAQHKKQLSDAMDEVNKLIEQGKIRAGKIADEIVYKARGEARDITEKAKAEIIREREQAVAEIREHVVIISLRAAEQLIQRTLEESDHRSFIEQAINEIDAKVK